MNQALLRARELNISVSVAVCDTGGRLIALNQMDGSVGWEEDRRSMGKAVAAAITGLPSDRLVEKLGKGGCGGSDRRGLFNPHTDGVAGAGSTDLGTGTVTPP